MLVVAATLLLTERLFDYLSDFTEDEVFRGGGQTPIEIKVGLMAPERYSYINVLELHGFELDLFPSCGTLFFSWLALLLFSARGRRTNRPHEQATAVKTWRTLPLVVEVA